MSHLPVSGPCLSLLNAFDDDALGPFDRFFLRNFGVDSGEWWGGFAPSPVVTFPVGLGLTKGCHFDGF